MTFEVDDMPQPPIDPFTNRWAYWCWRVHLAVPNFEPKWVLLVARVYSGVDQMGDLVPDAPTIDLSWLDTYLTHQGETEGKTFWCLPDVPDYVDFTDAGDAAGAVDLLRADRFSRALFDVWYWVVEWVKLIEDEYRPETPLSYFYQKIKLLA